MLTFNVDISAPSGPLVIYAMQADSMSRFFALTITDSGAAWTPPTGAIWTVRFGAPQMPSGWYDTITEPGGSTHAAVVVDENTATVEIAEQALSTPGQNVLCVLVTDAQGYQIASWPFLLNVQAVPGLEAPEATVYYNALTEQVAQVLSNATAAAASATLAQSWAVGGTGTREGENTNNAQYWAEQAQSVAQGQLGWFETEQALQAAHPTGENGQWAIIGSTDTIWTWDSDTSAWVDSGSTAALSNYYTMQQSDARYATAAQGALAASAVQSVNGLPGPNPSLTAANVGAAPASAGISTYTCTTSGTTHALEGTGSNIKFVADAAFAAGDTITVNGQAVTAQTQDGAALTDGAWASGATVVCLLTNTILTFLCSQSKNSQHNLVWTNQNPSHPFSGQTIQIPENNVLLIAFSPSNELEYALNEILIVKGAVFNMIGFSYNGFQGSRSVEYNADGVVFGAAGNAEGQSDDTKAVPLYIWAFK